MRAMRRANVILAAEGEYLSPRDRCELCGDPATDRHHDDYLKPLEVRPMCRSCHRNWHVANGPGLNRDVEIQAIRARGWAPIRRDPSKASLAGGHKRRKALREQTEQVAA